VIDFSVPKKARIIKSRRPYEVFKTVVHRVMKINQNLGEVAKAYKIVSELKRVSFIMP
jgi:hypothetical protein